MLCASTFRGPALSAVVQRRRLTVMAAAPSTSSTPAAVNKQQLAAAYNELKVSGFWQQVMQAR